MAVSARDGKYSHGCRWVFKATDSLMMLIINGVLTYVAFRINSRSLVRTIARRVCNGVTSEGPDVHRNNERNAALSDKSLFGDGNGRSSIVAGAERCNQKLMNA
jgi:hypothetical protein